MLDPGRLLAQQAPHRSLASVAQLAHLGDLHRHRSQRVGQHRTRTQRRHVLTFAIEQAQGRGPDPVAGLVNPVPLVSDVGHHAFRGIGRRGRPKVSDQIDDRRVRLVPDSAHHRRVAGEDGADQGFVRERQQILQRPTAPGDDDDVDLGRGVEGHDRIGDLFDAVVPLHGHVADVETDGRPARGRAD